MLMLLFFFLVSIAFEQAETCKITVTNECDWLNNESTNVTTGVQRYLDKTLENHVQKLESMYKANIKAQTLQIQSGFETTMKLYTEQLAGVFDAKIKEQLAVMKNMLQKHQNGCTDRPKFTNIALGKTAHQHPDIQGNINTASLAVDGKFDTISHTEGAGATPYWYVDLEKPYKIQRVEIYNRDDCCGERLHDLDVTIGTSLQSMKLCGHFKGPGTNKQHIVIDCSELKTGRYVMLKIAKNGIHLHVAEVQVYGIEQL